MGQPFQKEKKTVVELNGPPIMQGQLKTVSLADVLQLLANRGEKLLVLIHLPEGVGRVFLEGENLYHVETVGSEVKKGFEAFRFLLGLEDGRFEVRPPVRWPEEGNLKGPVQALIIEAIRQEEDGEAGETFFNADLFEKALNLEPPLADEPEPEPEESLLEKLKKKLPEVKKAVLLDRQGEVKEQTGLDDPEVLSGAISYSMFQLQEIGNLLGLGEICAFAFSSKKKLSAAISLGDQILGMESIPRKGLLWWSKKLYNLRKELKS